MSAKKTEFFYTITWILLLGLIFQALAQSISSTMASSSTQSPWKGQIPLVTDLDTTDLVKKGYQRVVFAGGCFWCMQGPFDVMPGVKLTRAGYAGGSEVNPKYKDVSYGRTSHTEAVEIWYDPKETNFSQLVEKYWKTMDPTDLGGQFADRGKQYRPVIFVNNVKEREIAEKSKAELQNSRRFSKDIVVPIEEYVNFYPAEEYHQFYYLKNYRHYKRYRVGSGREGFLNKYWK